LFVINCVSASISVIDLNTLALKQTLALPAFGNWGVNDTTANVGVGPGNILYYTDGSWAPVLRVLDRSTMQILQTDMIDPSSGSGFGDFGLTSDKKLLYGWMQYGWSAGIASSYISRFTVGADGLLTYTDSGASQYSTQFQRDPLETPVLIANDNKTIFIKGFAVSSNSASDIKYTFPTPVYSITPGGEIAVTATAIYETATGNKLLDLPVSTSVQTISSDYARLIYWDSSAHSLKFINLLSAIGPGILNRNITPANNSITLSPPQLQWTSLPGIDRYRVYFGTVEADVTAATTNSPLYLGQVNQTFFPINTTLTSGVKYFWRVDAVSDFDVAKGDTYNFTVSTISSSTNQISGATVQGHSDYITSFNLSSQLAGQDWQATANQSWVTFTQSNGVTPATVQVHLNASQLPVGLQSATITISSGGTALFSIPISLRVDALKMTQIRSDPVSALAYAVSEDTSVTPNRAYLLELDSAAEKILRVVAVGSSVTDIAVHNGDNRIYVPNWMSGSLLAINKTTFQLARTYAFAPFGGVGYSQGDIYRVAPGAPGRLIWEEEDQWIDVKIFDTVNATNMATAFERQGGGASTGGGRYYYHGDDNSSGATIHKFDLVGDQFAELANVRVQSYSYYGSRVVVASEDGSRVFWNGSMFDANLTELWTMADQVYCTSTNGQFAFGQNKIYDTTLKQAVLSMPAASTVSAYNTTSQKLIVQVGSSLAFYQISSPLTLPTPTLFADTITSSSVALHWTDKSLEDSFTVQMRIVGASNWTDVASPASNVTNYTATGLAPQTSYEFRVKANAAGATSAWSASVFANTPGISPTTPILTATSTFTSITVNWSNPTNETGFVLERTVGTNAFTTLAVLPADTLSFADNNVTQGTTYSYRIKATNSWGASAYSSTLNVTVPIPTPPATPTGLTVKVI
ncbi:MAG: fibronectin type III domain-containing protein, partial [Limisphaerales bacterium]